MDKTLLDYQFVKKPLNLKATNTFESINDLGKKTLRRQKVRICENDALKSKQTKSWKLEKIATASSVIAELYERGYD